MQRYILPLAVLAIIILRLSARGFFLLTYNIFSSVPSVSYVRGADSALIVLDTNLIHHVRIEKRFKKELHHFNLKTNVVSLGSSIYSGTALSFIAIAAYEAAHAVQYSKEYFKLKIRNSFIIAVNICIWVSVLFILLGLILDNSIVVQFICALFLLVYAVYLTTFLSEFKASSIAFYALKRSKRFSKK